jgi:signal transduction histidine kinase
VGISPVEMERLFERFENTLVRGVTEQPSTGIGLSVVKVVVVLHVGTIRAVRSKDKGTEFRLLFPKGLQ